MKRYKAGIKKVVAPFLLRCLSMAEAARSDRLRRSLRAVGKGGYIRAPVMFEVPEGISIGDDVTINAFVHIWGNAGVSIGDRTMIASHVAITSATHDPDSVAMYQSMVLGKVTISNDVWIGSHAAILPGVTIGEHAVIAAGAIVRSDVAPYTIVAGVPARFIRQTCGHRPTGEK